jgi:3-oxoacyl-[acyl-carrier-protein] synthase-3
MLGIEEIAHHLPELSLSNYDRKNQFSIDDNFIKNKIGFEILTQCSETETASTLCIKAFEELLKKTSLDPSQIDVAVVVTQNPDRKIPHVSAILHKSLDLKESCACFDISLGCSGYVYGLSIIQSFMASNGLSKGLLFTADPYSKIIDKNDKNTALLFGDAASVTLISDAPKYTTGKFTFGTTGSSWRELTINNETLYMNGRSIFNFAAQYVPKDVINVLALNNLSMDDIDLFVFHQGSKYIIDTLAKRLNINVNKAPFNAESYGNTVSSSIPILLEKLIAPSDLQNILLCGFGVGLSWSSTILYKTN